MKTFKEFMFENTLTDNEALSILGITSYKTELELKKAYKTASIKNHPDKGGSVEAMSRINAAYKLLQKSSANTGNMVTSYKAHKEEHAKKAQDWGLFIHQEYIKHFDIQAYTDYLSKQVDRDLTYISKQVNSSGFSTITDRWESKNKKIVFSLEMTFFNRMNQGGLSDSSSDLKIGEVSYSTEVLINNKKVKMTQSNYKFGAKTKNIFKDPTSSFPAAKIKKSLGSANKPLKKADYMLTFKSELGARMNGNIFRIPLKAKDQYGKDTYIKMERTTWMRKGMYYIQGVFNENGAKISVNDPFLGSFMESPKHTVIDLFAKKIKSLQKKTNIEQIVKELAVFGKKINDISLMDENQ